MGASRKRDGLGTAHVPSEAALRATERRVLADAVLSEVRHDVRNKLMGAMAASFLLRRGFASAAVSDDGSGDRRTQALFDTLSLELARIDEILTARNARDPAPAPRPIGLRACLDRAARWVVLPETIKVSVRAVEVRAVIDAAELIVAVSCVIEAAAHAAGGRGRIDLSARSKGGIVAIQVRATPARGRDARNARGAGERDPAGLSLTVARQAARRNGGDVVVRSDPPTEITLTWPEGEAAPPAA